MNSLASSLSRTADSARLSQAETWVQKAIAVINTAKDSEREPEVLNYCDSVLVATLFNMGSLKEVRRVFMTSERVSTEFACR